ncbi:SusF/SusE family outer membrane protein [Muricauda sp. HICW]|uniref:SusF/SusE family outer membrane protein n=1 Tax=Flagellimonas chongwuensis TaxID=2697365 RepID=A0A850ND38_9FLAO|nr:SusF/SusE family outer membrane protein [Allomuricauda chongwuensis]NVN19061.1 SusF/SusE family outer membrane protein [Allomuricauda chongwuensis]
MKIIYNNIWFAFLALIGLGLTSCENEDDASMYVNDELTTLKKVNFEGTPQVSPRDIVLTQEMQDEPAINVSWNKVVYPIAEAPVEYTLQFDVPSDTLGETAWQNATNIIAGSDVLGKQLNVKTLNTMAKSFGIQADTKGTLVYRVQAYMDRAIFSKAGAFKVTPYSETVSSAVVYVPGTYQGWDPTTAATLPETSQSGVFEGVITFDDPAALDFKFTTGPNWDENYGGDGNGNLVQDGDNAFVPSIGSYKIRINLNNLTWMAEPYSFGIIGTATPGGWDSDTDMTYNYQEGLWEFTGDLVAGALKFRLNDEWTVNYGSQNNTDFVAYLDDPGAHNVEAAGTYRVTFMIDNEDASVAYYTLEAQ